MSQSILPRTDQGQPKMAVSYRGASEALGVCERVVWQLVKDGKLKAFRCGKRSVRISITELERFIAEQTRQAGSKVTP
ncbi:MAG: excisionase family DNA binding protein [Planctomycetaceae bacterium]|jgi:excisionase family DNA binding protein